jgi:hypothetical protein
MRKLFCTAVTLVLIACSHAAYAQQCRDGIDNDGDGTRDALVNGSTTSATPTTTIATGNPDLIRARVAAILGYPTRDAFLFDDPTAQKICQVLGHNVAVSFSSRHNDGRNGFTSPGNNTLFRWNAPTGTFIGLNAQAAGNRWIATLVCGGVRPACANGRDDDGDGLIDLADPGCASENDSSEVTHDSGCSSPDDPTEAEQCRDGLDNDGDGLTDAADPGCWSDPLNPATFNPALENEGAATSQCQDGRDNDGDGATDLNDFSCSSRTDNDETNPRSACQDGVDNDSDGLVDLADPGCQNTQDNNEGDGTSACQDGIDNDADGATDFPADFSCSSRQDLDEANPRSSCQDGLDNDGDGLVDLADPGCSSRQDNNEGDGTSACQDGIDNDGDGATDFPADFSCSSKTDLDEANPKSMCQDSLDNDSDGLTDLADPGCSSAQDNNEGDGSSQCQDKLDNDGDGLIDLADPGCSNAQDDNEGDGTSACQDGIDNDKDGAIDFPADFSCSSKQDLDEANPKSSCQNGVDDDSDGLIDLADPGCSNVQDNNEGDGTSQCQDKLDNDNDGLTDLADPGCSNAQDNNEGDGTSACQDKVDNDGDGLIDLADPGCANAQDTNEVDDISRLQLTTECVFNNLDGTYTAYFGYENLLGVQTTVTEDAARSTGNSFSPTPANRNQPTIFQVGRQKGAFGVVFNGDAITWTVQIAAGVRSSATASRTSPACRALEPVAECIDSTRNGLQGTFGYVNSNEFEVKVNLGSQNRFNPSPEDRAQPTSFFPGTNKGVFTTSFKDQLTWNLAGKSATASATTPVCLGGCIGTSTTEIKGSLDAAALKLAKLTKDAATFLASQAKVKLRGTAAAKAGTDAIRAGRKADQFVKTANALSVQFPAVVKSCPNAAEVCQTVDRNSVIQALQGLYAQQRNSVKRIITRGYFNSTGRTNRTDKIIEAAKAAEQEGLAAISKLPRFATECK